MAWIVFILEYVTFCNDQMDRFCGISNKNKYKVALYHFDRHLTHLLVRFAIITLISTFILPKHELIPSAAGINCQLIRK